jgi:hypothetical protein
MPLFDWRFPAFSLNLYSTFVCGGGIEKNAPKAAQQIRL